MVNIEDWEELGFSTQYKLCSNLGERENARYFQQIEGEVFNDDNRNSNKILVGKLTGIKLLLGEGANNGWDAYSIFDNEQHTFNLGETIYDFEKDDWNYELNDKYHYDLTSSDVLYITSVEILPEYQGHKIGTRFIKDFIMNFVQGCSIIAVGKEPFYIQTNFDKELIKDEFTAKMNYNAMEEDREKITYKLLSYFLKIGFDYFPDFNEEFVFMCPALVNEKFAKIEFNL
jgi:GNAT superfamily N-acetyltransferase